MLQGEFPGEVPRVDFGRIEGIETVEYPGYDRYFSNRKGRRDQTHL